VSSDCFRGQVNYRNMSLIN
ncbi:Os11g0533550, partial [Oryza sativa Japonica Group]